MLIWLRSMMISLALSGAALAGDFDALWSQAQTDSGYTPLFAEDLSNALFTEKMWSFEEGILRPTPERVTKPLPPQQGKWKPRHPRNIWTDERYSDFILELEFKCVADTNSGVFIRCGDRVQWLHTSMEVQILQGEPKTVRNGIGAIYDCKATDAEAQLKPVGEWNQFHIMAQGSMLYVVLNGELINTMNLDEWTVVGENPDGSKNKFKTAYKDMPREGHVGLQYHGERVWFRNVRIKAL